MHISQWLHEEPDPELEACLNAVADEALAQSARCPECGEPVGEQIAEEDDAALTYYRCRCGWYEVIDHVAVHDRATVYTFPIGAPEDKDGPLWGVYQGTAEELLGAKVIIPAGFHQGRWHHQEWHKLTAYDPTGHAYLTLGKERWDVVKTIDGLRAGAIFVPWDFPGRADLSEGAPF